MDKNWGLHLVPTTATQLVIYLAASLEIWRGQMMVCLRQTAVAKGASWEKKMG